MSKTFKRLAIFIALTNIIILTACGDDNSQTNDVNDYSKDLNYTITGIEPGAGISVTTEKVMEEYDELEGWELSLSSTGAMMSVLDKAIENEDPIIITGWNPHWMFSKYPDMKYLEDPKGIYGGDEDINTLVKLGLEEEKPEAYKLISQFNWEVEDMEDIMFEANETDKEIETIAKQWFENNQDKVDEWIDGVADVDDVEFELVSTPWDSERASAAVLKEAMELKGFNVTVTPVDVAIMFESIANGDSDATVAAWLPSTHKDFYSQHKDSIEDLGPNLTGTKMGFTVPSYMNIDSIEDLTAK